MPPTETPEAPDTGYVFESLGEFAEYLFGLIQRQVTDTNLAVWCPRWWEHPEAMFRVWLLWHTFEAAAQHGPKGISEWMLSDADPHMRQLWAPDGPFKYCSARHGHKDMLHPLPCDWAAAPAELFAPTAPAATDPAAPAAA